MTPAAAKPRTRWACCTERRLSGAGRRGLRGPRRSAPVTFGGDAGLMSRGHLEHLHARDTALAYVSRAPFSKIEATAGAGLGRSLGTRRLEVTSTTTSTSRSIRRSRRPSTTPLAGRVPRPRRRGRARRRVPRDARASCASATASTTPTRSTHAAWRRSAARITCSMRRPSGARKSGRSPRGASRRRAARCPTSRVSRGAPVRAPVPPRFAR